jgi:hypothetical protein
VSGTSAANRHAEQDDQQRNRAVTHAASQGASQV